MWPGDDLADVPDPLAGFVLGPDRLARHVFVGGDAVVRDEELLGADLGTLRRDLAERRGACGPDRMVTVEDVRVFAMTLPGTYETLVRDRVKFRVGRYVYIAFSRDETQMGFGFPKAEREAICARNPRSS